MTTSLFMGNFVGGSIAEPEVCVRLAAYDLRDGLTYCTLDTSSCFTSVEDYINRTSHPRGPRPFLDILEKTQLAICMDKHTYVFVNNYYKDKITLVLLQERLVGRILFDVGIDAGMAVQMMGNKFHNPQFLFHPRKFTQIMNVFAEHESDTSDPESSHTKDEIGGRRLSCSDSSSEPEEQIESDDSSDSAWSQDAPLASSTPRKAIRPLIFDSDSDSDVVFVKEVIKNRSADSPRSFAMVTCEECSHRWDGNAQCQHNYGIRGQDSSDQEDVVEGHFTPASPSYNPSISFSPRYGSESPTCGPARWGSKSD